MRGKDNARTGGEILIDQLSIQGVRHAFCVPGESYLAALDAFYGSDIKLTVCRHESAAAIMAETVGKITGRPGICFVTRGPGATNASAGIHIARQDSSPMIVFVGQVGREMREREAFQELDYRAVFGTMAKWATEIDDPARIPEIVSRAFHTACNGRPGPVVIALPEDMLRERVSVPDATAFEPVEIWPGESDMSRLQDIAGRRQTSGRADRRQPVDGAGDAAMMRFAERFALPVATTFRRGHLFDAMHPCYAGDFGIGPNPKLLARVKGADLVLLIGGRFSEMPSQSYSVFDIPEPQIKLVHVHPGAEELGRVYHAHLAINAAPTAFCLALEECRRRRRSLGAARATPRMPTISPGAKRRRRCRARSISAKSWSGCATTCRRRDHYAGRRKFLRLGPSLLSCAKIRRARRRDVGLDGLWLAGRTGDADALS